MPVLLSMEWHRGLMLPDERTTHNNALTLPSQVEALLVAPGRGVARAMNTFLKNQGINVRIRDDSDSAFEEALMHPPDAILLDDRIAPSGAIDLCQRLKGSLRTHFIPTIILALNDNRQFRLRALAAGADAVFSPSVDAHERRTRLWALLRTRALQRQLEKKQRVQGTELVERRRWVAYLLHDLQGSVAALRANVDYLARFGPPVSDPRRADFDEAVDDAVTVFDLLMQSVHTVLDFERFDSGQLSVTPSQVKVGGVVAGLAKELLRLGPVREKGLDVIRPTDERTLRVDPDLLRRALGNLIMHCIRRGAGRTTVRVAETEGGVRITVSTPGTTPALPERRDIFEPYSQLGTKPVGYGLGLAMARAVVEMHGGKIWVDDVQGGGVAFVFTLPATVPSRAGPPIEHRASSD